MSTAWTYHFGPRRGTAQKIWNQKISARVGQTTKLLAQVKAIKVIGIEDQVTRYIHRLRLTEIKFSKRFRWMQTILISMSKDIFVITKKLANNMFA